MSIRRLDHYSIRTIRMDASRRFYADVLGFSEGPRPVFKFPGVWMYNGKPASEAVNGKDVGVLHIVGVDPDNPDGLRDYLGDRQASADMGAGVIDHIAFIADDLEDMLARLRRHDVPFRERSVPDLGLHQVFFEDPNGITIELNFPASE
jgi:catechol 2,3-dioxygenase-like lactoylglutathione lyase family enzyme